MQINLIRTFKTFKRYVCINRFLEVYKYFLKHYLLFIFKRNIENIILTVITITLTFQNFNIKKIIIFLKITIL